MQSLCHPPVSTCRSKPHNKLRFSLCIMDSAHTKRMLFQHLVREASMRLVAVKSTEHKNINLAFISAQSTLNCTLRVFSRQTSLHTLEFGGDWRENISGKSDCFNRWLSHSSLSPYAGFSILRSRIWMREVSQMIVFKRASAPLEGPSIVAVRSRLGCSGL